MILLIDNYDSFVFNLARYFERLGQPTVVVRNDAMNVDGVLAARPAAVVLSPGPCGPEQAGCCLDVVRKLHTRVPMLGICLGHQTIAAALGGRVVRATEPVHGRASAVQHRNRGLFHALPNPFQAARYHSLVVDESTLPDCLTVEARTADGVVMALAHQTCPVFGWQFHPESVLTDIGFELLAAFCHRAGLNVPLEIPNLRSELCEPEVTPFVEPAVPVTF